jgi:hypothetical protein
LLVILGEGIVETLYNSSQVGRNLSSNQVLGQLA